MVSSPRWPTADGYIGRVHMTHPNDPESTELFTEWDGDANTAYRFPHPDINYHSLELAHVRAQMPGGKPVEDLIPTFERVRVTDPKSFSPYLLGNRGSTRMICSSHVNSFVSCAKLRSLGYASTLRRSVSACSRC